MPINKDVSLSSQIHKSRDEIRSQITDYMRSYLELENVDLTKSSFLSFMVNTMATLTSNLMFYQSSVYREFFLTKAQLSESVYSLSSFLGYDTKDAYYSSVDLLFTIPLGFESNDVEFEIPIGYVAKAGDVAFKTNYQTIVRVINNSDVNVTVYEENRSYNVPVGIDTEENEFYFLLSVNQFETNNQEFQIEEDLRKFQFVNIDVPLSGKLSEINVSVRPPGNSNIEPYEEFSSLYLIGPEERGFVKRKIDDGIRLYFGNGLIGYQPEPGSTVLIETLETEGVDGNVIPGSIKDGDRIIVYDDERQVLNYSITNPEPSIGGYDEESIEEIRKNSISNLKSMNRLVSSTDYDDFHIIMGDDAFRNSIPILKRSDLKVNEIQLFTVLYQGDDLIPTRNEYIITSDLYTPRGTLIEVGGQNFVTMLDLSIDPLNKFAEYYYYIGEVTQTPILDTTESDFYGVIINEFSISRYLNDVNIEVKYQPSDDDLCDHCDHLTCELQILEVQRYFDFTNNTSDRTFNATIPFTELPNNYVTLLFHIYYDDDLLVIYSSGITFKKDMSDIMTSNVVIDPTAGEDFYIVYDVPIISEEFILNQENLEKFESIIVQRIINLRFEEKRMLTDFLNLKFANTVGYVTNMLKNETSILDVITLTSELPENPSINDRYILNTDSNIYHYDGTDWRMINPNINNIVYVGSLNHKLLFTGIEWINPVYELPIRILLEVFIFEEIIGTESGLIEEIKDSLYNSFIDRFGPNMSLYKSEIINIVQNIGGIKYCHILKPESDIFLDYDISKFNQDELLEYTPELVYFTKDSITIRVFRG